MKKITLLILLLAGIPAAAQHPIPPERQALIRRVAVPILADTLKTAAGRSSKSFSTNYNYKADISVPRGWNMAFRMISSTCGGPCKYR